MRSRILLVVIALVVLVLLGLGVPLARSLSGGEQQQMFLDRLTMTERLASLAQQPLLDGQNNVLGTVLQRYQEVYGIAVAVVGRDGAAVVSSRVVPPLSDVAVHAHLGEAMAGRQPEAPDLFLPWEQQSMVLAEPVMVDGEVYGAVVTVSATDELRMRVLGWWALVLAGASVVLALAIGFALPVVEWILRPIHRLDEVAGQVATAVTTGTEPDPAALESGPPELRKLARSFDALAAQVSKVLAAQRAFVADASHQLRNPLTALNLRLSNLDGMVVPDGVDDYAAAEAEAQRLNEVLDELLTLARAEAAGSTLVPIDASAVLRERVQVWRPVAAARDLEMRDDVPDGLSVYAAPHAVDRILDALLDNAVKFCSVSAGSACIEVNASIVDDRVDGLVKDMVRIAVRDHGPGLDPVELDRITDRFWRSPSQQNVAGSGLGMAIVRQIVDRSRGRLRLDLPDGGGLRITVELPAAGKVR